MALRKRVRSAADAACEQKPFVTFVDVLTGIGFVTGKEVEEWRKGGIPYLTQILTCESAEFREALREYFDWARSRGAKGADFPHAFRGPGGRVLRFTPEPQSDPFYEELLRRCFLGRGAPARARSLTGPEATPARRAPPKEEGPSKELLVFEIIRDSRCGACGDELRRGSFLTMEKGAPLCADCADLGHLVFLPSGNPALTRRAREYSRLSAVVVKFSRARKRYERQGILVEEDALAKAEEACLADQDRRTVQRERAAIRRSAGDAAFVEELTARIFELYPNCPREEARAIAEHTALRGSGRVGRSAAGRALEEEAVRLAVAAAVRHHHTGYDEWLMKGVDRGEARARAAAKVEEVLRHWER